MTLLPIRLASTNPGKFVGASQEVGVSLCAPGISEDDSLILSTHWAKLSAATGTCVVPLEPNSTITPAGTWYVARFPDDSQFAFIVTPDLPADTPTDMTTLLADDPSLPGPIVLGVESADDIAAVGRNIPVFTTPGGVSKVWTPRQFGWTGSGDATAIFADMLDSGEQHFDLGAEHYDIEGVVTFGEGVNIDGRGGKGKGLDRGATCFVLQDIAAQVHFRSAGFGAHRFGIDCNNIAQNPLYIGGTGTGDVGAQPDLSGLCVMQAAPGGSALTIDGTQNGRCWDLTLLNNAGEQIYIIDHEGGWDFFGTEITGGGSHNVHINSSGHVSFTGGTFERCTSPTASDVLVDGVVWFPKVRFTNITFASGGAVATQARYLVEHRATGTVVLDGCDFSGITNDIAIGVQGVADGTFPFVVVTNEPYFTGAGMLGFWDIDANGSAVQFGDIGGQVAAGVVPLHASTSTKANLTRINRPAPVEQTLSADGAVALDLSLGEYFIIHKNGHSITGLTASNGYDGQKFDLSIQQGTTVTTDTLPGAVSGWFWDGGDSGKPVTGIPLGVVTARMRLKSGSYFQVSPSASRDAARPSNYQAAPGSYVLPPNLTTAAASALSGASSGLFLIHPIDLEPGKTYTSLAVGVSVAQIGGTTTTTLALYTDSDGTPLLTGGPVASCTPTLTSTGNRGAAITFTATQQRYWAAWLYTESVAPSTRATVYAYASGQAISTATIGSVPRGRYTTGLAAMPTTQIGLADQPTPIVIGVGA